MSEATGALPPGTPVAVIGAGTMGSGIAMVAAAAGHPVLLHDAADGAAKAGLARERAALDVLVARGKLDEQTLNERLARVRIAETVADLSPAGLVIEAIVENLDVKAETFRKVEAVVAPSTILVTNTSSLSVTALAGRLARPGRFGGLHFFNPPTILPLVEIVRSALSEPEVITTLYETARAWGKTPVLCASTPGFIVNRVARPFYAEVRLVLTGDAIGAEEALALGMISETAPDGDALAQALALAERIIEMPPVAVHAIKQAINLGQDVPLETALALERQLFVSLFGGEDQREGMRAFLEKRPPVYSGR